MIDQKAIDQVIEEINAYQLKHRLNYSKLAKMVGVYSHTLRAILLRSSQPRSGTFFKMSDFAQKIREEEK